MLWAPRFNWKHLKIWLNKKTGGEKNSPKESFEDLLEQLKDEKNLVRIVIYPMAKQFQVAPPAPSIQPIKPPNSLPTSSRLKKDLPEIMGRPLLSLCLLSLLESQARYGNEILNWLKARGELFAASSSNVYPLLRQWERDDLIKGRWESGGTRSRRVYEITAQGRDALENLRQTTVPQLRVVLDRLEEILKEI